MVKCFLNCEVTLGHAGRQRLRIHSIRYWLEYNKTPSQAPSPRGNCGILEIQNQFAITATRGTRRIRMFVFYLFDK